MAPPSRTPKRASPAGSVADDRLEKWIEDGLSLLQRGDPASALQSFQRAAALAPESALVQAYVGTAQLQLGAFREASAALRHAVRLDPNFAEAYYNLGLALQRSGDAGGAETAWRRATDINPFYLKPWNNLALAVETRGDAAAAREILEQALSHAATDDPNIAELLNNYGNLLDRAGLTDSALKAYETAVACRPDAAKYRCNLGNLLLAVGRVDAALGHLAQARKLDPELQDAAHAHLLGQLYRDGDETVLRANAEAWAETLDTPKAAPHDNTKDPGRRLRIGYVSPDLYRHVVAFFIEKVLAAHDRSAVEVFCYANVHAPDATTGRLRKLADHWCDTRAMDDAALAAKIRADGIDVLIDLAGHTTFSRVAVFAQRPAPLQLSWIGYPATTGVKQMDWRIVDAITDPPGMTDAHNSEKLLRLPGGFNVYTPPDEAPLVGPLPALANGYVTFGCFNHAAKITPEALRLWAALLRIVPGARLTIKHRGLDLTSVRDEYLAEFTRLGTAADRLDLAPPIREMRGHLDAYNRVDVALDTFPYNGTTTTCEALWMGVPVVTLAGTTHRARVSASILTRVGLLGFVAETPRDYVGLAQRLAGDLPRLAELRAGLRETVAASPVCDAAALTRKLEAALRNLWSEWCRTAA